MITLGDKGVEVSKLQKLLSFSGYDLVIDGIFGPKTFRSLKALQKKYGLKVNGVADFKTNTILKTAQKRTSKEVSEIRYGKNYNSLSIDSSIKLNSEQYIKQILDKDKIFIHHTCNGPSINNAIKNLGSDYNTVSSAFIISSEKGGKIYELYNPNFWSFHLGAKGTNGKHDRSSIAVELCSWGQLTKKNGKYFSFNNIEIEESDVQVLEDKWRGSFYYHKYSDEQITSLKNLLIWIIREYKIQIQNIKFDENWLNYNDELVKHGTQGIWSHSSMRKDVQDLYPDQRLFEVLNNIKL